MTSGRCLGVFAAYDPVHCNDSEDISAKEKAFVGW